LSVLTQDPQAKLDGRPTVKIADIDVIPIHPRLAARYAGREVWFHGIDRRTVYRVRADNGLVGYGDHRLGGLSRASLQPLIGCDPFEFVNADLDPGLGGALYDLMGKALEVPAYRLMGPKVRDAVSVAAWTSRSSADDFGSEVERAAHQGYGVIKMHTAPFFDVLEQTRAAEDAAPPGFRLHYDFNGNRTLSTALPLVRQLEAHPVVGFIEDPFPKADRDAWCRLRAQSHIPLIFHVAATHAPLPEVTAGVADTYLFSGVSIGRTLTGGAACACANTQVLLQLTGGTLAKALALHMAAVLPTATGHSIHLDDQYEDDVTTARLPVVAGASKVPEGPGLGVDVDEDALAHLAERAAAPPSPPPRCVGILSLPGGHRWYTSLPPDVVRLTGREEGDLRGVSVDLWQDDGSERFERIYGQVARDGAVEADPAA
jgi:L-alanine-DL-glutamate epimerase-like enolase superfamily enzyme